MHRLCKHKCARISKICIGYVNINALAVLCDSLGALPDNVVLGVRPTIEWAGIVGEKRRPVGSSLSCGRATQCHAVHILVPKDPDTSGTRHDSDASAQIIHRCSPFMWYHYPYGRPRRPLHVAGALVGGNPHCLDHLLYPVQAGSDWRRQRADREPVGQEQVLRRWSPSMIVVLSGERSS